MSKEVKAALPTETDIERLLPIDEVVEIMSFSKASIYRKITGGSFPGPLKIGQSRVAWRRSAIADWLARQRPASEAAQPYAQ